MEKIACPLLAIASTIIPVLIKHYSYFMTIIIFGHGKPENGWNYLKKHIFDDFPIF